MGTFVLVHGAWGGGWSWRPTVGKLLRDAGHEVFTPTLTGLGERGHLASPAVDLETHIQDIVNVIEFENLRDVVLMGHSYGGMVISEAAAGRDDRVDHLVYLCALMLRAGQSPMEGAAGRPVALGGALQVDESGRSTVADHALVPAFYGDVDPERAADAIAKLRDFPVASLASVQHEPWRTIESTYVRCLQDQAIHPDHQAEMAEAATHLVEWDCAHSPFLSDVDLVIGLLERLARP